MKRTTYRERLPDGCPPENAETVDSEQFFFRLVRQEAPTEEDFKSQREKRPLARFMRVSECRALGLSIYSALQACKTAKEEFTNLRKHKICRVTLKSGAGKIQQTGINPFHFTWWPYADYNILVNCYMEN